MSWHFNHLQSQARTVMQTKELWVKITFLQSSQVAGFHWAQWLSRASHLQWQGHRVKQKAPDTALFLPNAITLYYSLPQSWEVSVWNEEQMVSHKILSDGWAREIGTLIVFPFEKEIHDWLLNHLFIVTHW